MYSDKLMPSAFRSVRIW